MASVVERPAARVSAVEAVSAEMVGPETDCGYSDTSRSRQSAACAGYSASCTSGALLYNLLNLPILPRGELFGHLEAGDPARPL
jgi:hypothetical protein